ncbi:uncharacterized exonuclease domain-containing protein At3g15140 isoform X2 [Cryptomeria japonica]|uniref:uncharacterized exonuclease domain-containing protein At3g15140 isoform X2 n=1 Tax=Cryptomeria japonica TaxID=3369 RepID=UPI0027DAB14F|nr:uncharacterized exonuclease domain-containing protein At3g15140 isoform X2 [Cryptomeria japonica]
MSMLTIGVTPIFLLVPKLHHAPSFCLRGRKRAAYTRVYSSIGSAHASSSSLDISDNFQARRSKYWQPMCLYFTQDKCTKMDDPQHLEKFSHCYSSRLQVEIDKLKNVRPQQFDYFLVLDLEGKVEIVEFPVLMIDAHTLKFVDAFHRFVRPDKMSEERIDEYIEGKYGKQRLDRVWHDTAIPFGDTLQQFEIWLGRHNLWEEGASTLHSAAFVTCGNWDVKTKIPQQCQLSRINLPPYFMEWINLKDVYLNFYKQRAAGMVAMLKGLGMPIIGTHHVGLDDAQNIARVLQRMLVDGAMVQITARRTAAGPSGI